MDEMDKHEVYKIAEDAIKKLEEVQGPNARFPFDAIWAYTERAKEVPNLKKASAATYLIKQGYIESTGGVTNAGAETRKGSPTREYKLGRVFRQTQVEGFEDLTVSNAIVKLEKAMDANGFIISARELANFYLGLLTSPLVIVAGLSGTGKSRLPRLFARLIEAEFFSISVQPQWSDNADLLGYTSALDPSRFVEGKIIKALQNAEINSSKATIVLLDEMNLAPVEHYFSDFLSVVESRERQDGGLIATDPIPLDLPQREPGEDPYEHLRNLQVPSNIFVVGTANMDETTRMFSPKVLDRAFTIEFNEIDLTVFPSASKENSDVSGLKHLCEILADKTRLVSVQEAYHSTETLFDCVASLLEEIRFILKPAEISFGYRSRDAILIYLWHWQQYKLQTILPFSDALDLCILQKILPKISGTGEVLGEVLETLKNWLDTTRASSQQGSTQTSELCAPGPFEKSSAKVAQMIYRLENEGATTYWVH